MNLPADAVAKEGVATEGRVERCFRSACRVRSNLRARLSRQLSLSWRLIGARFTSSFLGVH